MQVKKVQDIQHVADQPIGAVHGVVMDPLQKRKNLHQLQTMTIAMSPKRRKPYRHEAEALEAPEVGHEAAKQRKLNQKSAKKRKKNYLSKKATKARFVPIIIPFHN